MQNIMQGDAVRPDSHPETDDSRRQDDRPQDWHFELLAEFEEMLKLYEQDHVSGR